MFEIVCIALASMLTGVSARGRVYRPAQRQHWSRHPAALRMASSWDQDNAVPMRQDLKCQAFLPCGQYVLCLLISFFISACAPHPDS